MSQDFARRKPELQKNQRLKSTKQKAQGILFNKVVVSVVVW